MRRLLSVTIVLFAPPLFAIDYHVAIGGDDGNPGTSSQPWSTVQHAVDSVAAGDRILVHQGSYLGARVETSGTAGLPITLQSAPGETATLTAPGPSNQHDSTLELETWDSPGIVSYWVVQNFEIVGGARSGVDLRFTSDIVVRGNTVHSSGLTGIFTAFSYDPVIENNESFGNGEHGIYHSNSGDRPIIRGNHLHDNFAAGIHMNADVSQGGDGIITGAVVEKNVIHGNGVGGGSGINMDGVSSSVVVNNLIHDEHASGISVFQQDGAVCSSDNLIAHNTVLTASDGRWALNMPDPGCTGNRFIDNILWTDHSWRGSLAIWSESPAGFESHHNAVMDRFSIDGGDTRITFAEWQALGWGAGSFLSDPSLLFVAEPGDFHLADDGPAVDAGSTLPEVPEDLEGSPRPQGLASDMGCYEAGALVFGDGFDSGDTSAWSATVE